MMYIVHYVDDNRKQHIAFVKTYKEVKFLEERFGGVTVESHHIED